MAQQRHLRSGRYLTDQPSNLGHLASPPVGNSVWTTDEGWSGGAEWVRPRGVRTSFVVYYLERGDGRIKIGCTGCYYRRRAQLLKQHGPLSLVAWEEGDNRLEFLRHRQFAELRVDPIAEWFEPGPALIDWILNIRALMA